MKNATCLFEGDVSPYLYSYTKADVLFGGKYLPDGSVLWRVGKSRAMLVIDHRKHNEEDFLYSFLQPAFCKIFVSRSGEFGKYEIHLYELGEDKYGINEVNLEELVIGVVGCGEDGFPVSDTFGVVSSGFFKKISVFGIYERHP